MKKQSLPIPAVIHLFAAAHAAVAVLSRLFNYVDDVPLTVLTISMIVVISIRRGLQMELTAALTFFCSFFGYLIGIYGARIIELGIHSDIAAPAITTALITEAIGWITYSFTRMRGSLTNRAIRWSPSTYQIVLIASAILVLRICYTLIFRSTYFEQEGIYPEFQRLLSNTFALLTLLCGNIIFVNIRHRLHDDRRIRTVWGAAFIALFSAVITLMVYYGLPQGNNALMDYTLFGRLLAVILLAELAVYALLSLINYVLASNAALRTERGKKHRAQFRYDRLKLQINPHFLFNSLNILDYLVQEQQTERASAFIRKLAGTYRYMLKNENEPLVSLAEELTFAEKYIDLLRERFASGFIVEIDISEESMRRLVVPCCLQLLIENATKHNVVSPEQPLVLHIGMEDELLTVRNNLQPRISAQASTGMGLNNIRQQYLDISGKQILVEKTQTHFCVKLPLL